MSDGLKRGPALALDAVSFFMADMQAGIGPFLGVFLLAHGWQSGKMGTVMALGGLAGVLMTAPAGALVDATTKKRALVVVPGICTVLASAIILVWQGFVPVAASQIATGIAGAAIMPAVAGITLGMVRQSGFNRRNGRNQAFNHAGNVVGASLSGLLGRLFGLPAVFYLSAAFGLFTVGAIACIPTRAIDHDAARGIEDGRGKGQAAGALRALFDDRRLLTLAAALAIFHLGNAAMLPLFGVAVCAAGNVDPASFVALTIVVAQAVMCLVSVVAIPMIEARGYWLILLISFVVLPIRALVAAKWMTVFGLYPVQILDGVGAGLQSVAVPGLAARLLAGTGRVNVGQGALMTAQGVGAALSPAIGGWLAQLVGWAPMFLILGTLSVGSLALWLPMARRLKRVSS